MWPGLPQFPWQGSLSGPVCPHLPVAQQTGQRLLRDCLWVWLHPHHESPHKQLCPHRERMGGYERCQEAEREAVRRASRAGSET